MLAPLHGKIGLQRIIVARLLLPAHVAHERLKASDGDCREILELHSLDERLREAERRQIETRREGLLLLLAISVADADIKHRGGADQVGVVYGDAFAWTMYHIAARSCNSWKIVIEVKESVAAIDTHEHLVFLRQLMIEFCDPNRAGLGPLA